MDGNGKTDTHTVTHMYTLTDAHVYNDTAMVSVINRKGF